MEGTFTQVLFGVLILSLNISATLCFYSATFKRQMLKVLLHYIIIILLIILQI